MAERKNEREATRFPPELAWAAAVLNEMFESGMSGSVTIDFPGNGVQPKVRDSRVRPAPSGRQAAADG